MIAFFVSVIFVVGILILLVAICLGDRDSAITGMVGGMLILIGIAGFSNIFNPSPEALDVYRGNTELKITGTYEDSVFVPTDSIVIFKINQYE